MSPPDPLSAHPPPSLPLSLAEFVHYDRHSIQEEESQLVARHSVSCFQAVVRAGSEIYHPRPLVRHALGFYRCLC